MSPACSGSSSAQYSTSEKFALVHRPAPSNADGNLHKSDGQEQHPLKYQPPVNDCPLRTRLGLGNWKCGRYTRTGTDCSNGILTQKRDEIESLISSMIFLSQESPELISKMERLAQLANCQSHRRKDPQDARKTKWMAAFPVRNSDVRCLEEQVRAVFEPASTICGAAGTESNLCGEKVGGRKVQNFQRTIGEIMKLRIYLRDSYIDHYLGILEKNVYCSDHELTTPLRKQDYWKSRILEIRTMADLDAAVSTPGHYGPLDSNDQKISSLRIPPSSGIDKNPTSLWLEAFDTTPFHIIPRRNRRKMNTLNDYIQSIIGRKLSIGNRKPGYIYVFQAENIKEYLKIGYTTAPVIERLQSLSFDCNRRIKVLFPTPPESAKMVPNAFRVEELCHAELVDCQVHIDCTGCLCEHEEWYQISTADAIAVVKKWSAWMNSIPYDPELRSLKKKEKRKVSDTDNFMNELARSAT